MLRTKRYCPSLAFVSRGSSGEANASLRTFSSTVRSSTSAVPRILVTGALGQIGTELVPLLRQKYGSENVVASDMRISEANHAGPFAYIDILRLNDFERVVVEQRIDWLIHNASILSAAGELNPSLALQVNFEGTPVSRSST